MYSIVSVLDDRLGIFTQAASLPSGSFQLSISCDSLDVPSTDVNKISSPSACAEDRRSASVLLISTGKSVRVAATFVESIVICFLYCQLGSNQGAPGGGTKSFTALSTLMRGKNNIPLRLIGFPVDFKESSISSTVAVGLADFRTAHAPATCGVAIDVPLFAAKLFPGTDDVIEEPGASKSKKLAVFEKLDMASVFVVELTLTTLDIHAGVLREFEEKSFPAAAIVAIPFERRLSTDCLIKKFEGSASQAP